jgi:methionyl-tRNA formyltransferase
MRLIFCGTPRFAIPTLERLVEEKHSVELVVTNPDEPAGRGQELKAPPVKEAARRLHLLVFQPAKFRDPSTKTFLSMFEADAIIVAAYGHILPPWALELPRLGCVNLHASLLPKYRGAAPIPWAIVRGERETGVTTMKMDEGMDTGGILLEQLEPISETDTASALSERLSVIGADLMAKTLRGLERGEIAPRPQDANDATYAPILKKADGKIDWSLPAEVIGCRVRGFNPWPGAFTSFRGKMLHIWAAVPSGTGPAGVPPGTLVVGRGQAGVVCGKGSLLALEEVQFEARKRLRALEFARGARLQSGEKLGT